MEAQKDTYEKSYKENS